MNQPPDKPRIVFLDRATLAPSVTLHVPGFAHDMISYDRSAAADVAGRIENADIVITNKVKLTESAIAQAQRLRFVAVAATGTDNVDLAACRARGIIVSNIRDYAVNTVPEHTFALILALRRSLLAYR
ncbi:MAG TPA: glycerate dehydrogenase, partial [Acetobacteraceae bacterium]|nr:glycerate dehydrogenase [Acetobacteraceae bacterium]